MILDSGYGNTIHGSPANLETGTSGCSLPFLENHPSGNISHIRRSLESVDIFYHALCFNSLLLIFSSYLHFDTHRSSPRIGAFFIGRFDSMLVRQCLIRLDKVDYIKNVIIDIQ